MDFKIEPVEGVRKIKGAKVRLHKRQSLRGMYYGKLINRIYAPSKQQGRPQAEGAGQGDDNGAECHTLDIEA